MSINELGLLFFCGDRYKEKKEPKIRNHDHKISNIRDYYYLKNAFKGIKEHDLKTKQGVKL